MSDRQNVRVIRARPRRRSFLLLRPGRAKRRSAMLMNNLDPEVAGAPGSSSSMAASAARRAIGKATTPSSPCLRRLRDDQTLLVQSGKPGRRLLRRMRMQPRVLIANSNPVPAWATWDHFNALDRAGLMMYGQMTAGSWIYRAARDRAGHL